MVRWHLVQIAEPEADEAKLANRGTSQEDAGKGRTWLDHLQG